MRTRAQTGSFPCFGGGGWNDEIQVLFTGRGGPLSEVDFRFFFLVVLVGLLRYAHVIEHYGSSLLNTLGLAAGWICAAGLIMVGNFQVKTFLHACKNLRQFQST